MSPSLVIIPTYNEKENIVDLIRTVFALPARFDVLVVDDNSPDGTAALVEELQAKYNQGGEHRLHLLKREGKEGLGTAYIAGFRYAMAQLYPFILEMDADFSHNPSDLVRLQKSCADDGLDVAVGSRYISGVNVVNWPIGRVLMSYFASSYVRLITRMPIRDTTAGFVCYRREVLETIPLDKIRFAGYAFPIEMKFLSWKYGFRIGEIPIVFTDRTRGTSKLSAGIFKEAFMGVIQMTVQSWFTSFRRLPASQTVLPLPEKSV